MFLLYLDKRLRAENYCAVLTLPETMLRAEKPQNDLMRLCFELVLILYLKKTGEEEPAGTDKNYSSNLTPRYSKKTYVFTVP